MISSELRLLTLMLTSEKLSMITPYIESPDPPCLSILSCHSQRIASSSGQLPARTRTVVDIVLVGSSRFE